MSRQYPRYRHRFVLLDNFYDVGDASMEGWA